ncbi:MAG: ribonuclease / adenosylcobalamin/alpha-ribazole phosphatase [Solirubrobacteraceae bacterium]|nr:ribonuclease / adenosylcobalamin/alpha-ribazole phosphatase [Solirubrobacteraceae bacterium]
MANVFDRDRARPEGDVDRLTERGWEQARGLGRRLRDEGIETILASPMRRAQETASAINEVLDLPLATDEDLFEVRQSDAFYANLPDAAEHATLAWMPTAPADEAPAGAESFAEILGRVKRVRERLDSSRVERVLAVSHYGFLHFLLGLTMFGEDFGPEHILGVYSLGHANTGISIFTRHEHRVLDGIPFPGWALTTWNDRAHL